MEAENLRLKKTNTALRQALSSLQKSAERAVGNMESQCDLINDDNQSYMCKDFYYKKIVKCDICQDADPAAVEKTAECSTSSDCESPYTDCWMGTCVTEINVGFNPFASKCSKRNDCIYDCQEADSSKTKYDCMKECPKSLCEEEKAVGGSWQNGKCMSFGSYLNFDSGAVVQDMGTGWSE
eukprot:UN22178